MGSINAKVMIHLNRHRGLVSPMLHGYFIEHAGQSVYDGIWTRGNTNYSKHPGLRMQIVNPLRKLQPGIVQWPGGHFANTYHWEEGIGTPASRASTENLAWGGKESNYFGTDEFNRFCSKVDAEPHHCLNITTGSVRDAVHWLEYCNLGEMSHFGRMRSRSSHPEPFLVKYWSVGYEPWQRGGYFTASDYAREFIRYAGIFKQISPALKMMCCGRADQVWNRTILETLGDTDHLLDILTLSADFSSEIAGGSRPSTENEYYALFGYLPVLEEQILRTVKTLQQYERNRNNRNRIRIAFTEWGVQHPEARRENSLLQPSTMRDALMAACTLHLFYRYGAYIQMAHIAQPVNSLHCLIRVHREAMHFTPTYHVFDLLRSHIDQKALNVQTKSPTQAVKTNAGTCNLPLVQAFCTRNNEGNTLTVSLLNLDIENEAEVTILLKNAGSIKSVQALCLAAESPNEENDFTAPRMIEPEESVMDRIDNPSVKILPPASVTRLKMNFT